MSMKIMFTKFKGVVLLLMLMLLTLVLILPVQAQEQTPIYLPIIIKAGSGSSPSSSSAFDVIISLYNAPTGAARTPIEENIRYFADAVYEMSNGAHKIRQVRIYSNRQFVDRADVVWVQNCWPNAHLSAYGKGGGFRIEHCDNFQGFSFLNTPDGNKEGGYTIGHEWGHYFYGMMDEYRGQQAVADWAGRPLSGDTAVPNSIMNGQFQAVQGDFSWLNFSTDLNNTPVLAGQNAQQRVYAESAWDTLTRPPAQDPPEAARANVGGTRLYYPELAQFKPTAGQAPSLELPGAQGTARDQLQIVWMGNKAGAISHAGSTVTEPGTVRYIVIENSDSMTSTDKLVNVIDAVGELIDDAEIGDTLGIITFDSTVNVVQPLTKIDSDSTRTTILAALDGITQGGSGAATGNAARQALTEISSQSIDLNRAVYLISGGPVTTGENLATGVIPTYTSEDVELYTFGYGVDEATETKLQNAEATGGDYNFIDATDPDDAFEELLDVLEDADQSISPIVDVDIKTDAGMVLPGITPFTDTFEIDSSLGAIEVEVLYPGPKATIALLGVADPISSTIPTATSVDDCEELTAGSTPTTICTLEISEPISGTWTLGALTGGISPVEIEYWFGGLAEDGDFTLVADIESEQGENVDVGEKVVLYTAVANEQFKVTGVTLNAFIIDPNGMEAPLLFTDDGMVDDDLAGDGIYTTSYTPSVAGEHEVVVEFDNNNNLAEFTETGNQFAADRTTGITKQPAPNVLVDENFERFAGFEFDADMP